MDTIAIDGLNEDAFRRSIEGRLRQGLADNAIQKIRSLLVPYAGPGKILPERFLTVKSSDLVFHGWEGLGDAIARYDRPGWPVTAIAISFGWPGEEPLQFDAQGGLNPLIETSFFTDEAYPFSQSAREDLLDGYSYHGCSWSDQGETSSTILSLAGIDDLHGALAALEAELLASEEPDEEGVRAGSLGACLLSALLVQAVGERLAREALPRPLCVLSGSNGVYPYFDAPVAGMPEEVLKADEDDDLGPLKGAPGPRYSSLLVTGIPRARKRAVLVLEEDAEERALRNANLRALNHPEAAEPVQVVPTEPDQLAPELANAGITPAPGGPLMSKNPAKKAWDFRDMLGEAEAEDGFAAEPHLGAEATYEPEEAFEAPADLAQDDDWDLPGDPQPEPVADLLAEPPLPEPESPLEAFEPQAEDLSFEPEPVAPRIPRLPAGPLVVEAVPEPGFALIEPNIEQRLQILMAPPKPVAEPLPLEGEPDILELESIAPDDEPPVKAAQPDIGPAWPLGIGWLEDAEAEEEPLPLELFKPVRPAPGLLARLRAWIGRGR